MSRLNHTLKILVLMIVLGQVPDAGAQQSAGNFGVELDSRTLSVQAKAEELFQREHYHRAHAIYLNDLAPIGDKYAQYMLGFMSLSGLGVEQDQILASAWYRLAAERGEPEEFVAIRDQLLEQLEAAERQRSDAIYLQLRREYSDIAIRMRDAREAFEDLRQVTTGSRLGGSPVTAVTIVEPSAGTSVPGEVRVQRARRRMQSHLDYVTAQLGIDRIEAEAARRSTLAELDARVRDYLAQLQTP